MAPDIGTLTLILALVLSIYSILASIVGYVRQIPQVIDSGRYASYTICLLLIISTASLVASFLSHDFSVKYVAEHSNLVMPKMYTWVAFYAGNEGSLLFIAVVLSILSAIALRLASKEEAYQTLPYTNVVLMLILAFFVGVMIFLASPFERLDLVPVDGEGVNPLLIHPGMFIHPPTLMTGLIATSIPFSFAMGALLSGKTGDEWIDHGRSWGLFSWAVLGSGLLLGSWWAYTILGWGGYWGWDPVENAGLMPWLGLTAFVHSIMIQKRRGIFRMWNIALIIIAFGLAQFGMFINRGGPVPSVHSFGASTLGMVFLSFMAITMAVSLAVFLTRFKHAKHQQPLESPLSREAAFLVNNLLLLTVAFVTLWGVVFPIISEIFEGKTVTVGAPFYNQVNGPVLLGLVFLMAAGPLLPWRHASISNIRRAFIWPLIAFIVVAALLFVAGIRNLYALISFGTCAMVVAGILKEWISGTKSTYNKNSRNYLFAFFHLIFSNRPRYGGYIVHLAIVALSLGVIGTSFYSEQQDVVLSKGESITLNDYKITYVDQFSATKPDHKLQIAEIDLYKNDAYIETLEPWKAFYPVFNMISTRAAIRSTPLEDFYIIYSEDVDQEKALFRIYINPLMMWIWIAGPLLILGALVSLWPQQNIAKKQPEETDDRPYNEG